MGCSGSKAAGGDVPSELPALQATTGGSMLLRAAPPHLSGAAAGTTPLDGMARTKGGSYIIGTRDEDKIWSLGRPFPEIAPLPLTRCTYTDVGDGLVLRMSYG
jgi:hypothetical protein